MKRHRLQLLVLSLISALGLINTQSSAAGSGTPATTTIATELRSDANLNAPVQAKLPANAAVLLGERKGGWYRAEYQGKTGWLRLLSVRLAGAKVSNESALAALAKASSNTQSTTGTGIRGLTEEQLQKSKANMQELAIMEAQQISAAEAAAYASAGSVQPVRSKE